MAQHDYVIDNSTGANVRADINNALLAISSTNSGSSAPSTTYAFQLFANTTTSKLQIRNAANNAFVDLIGLDGSILLADGSVSAPSLAFADDSNTGLFSSAADTFNVATGGVERMELGATTIFNESGADVDFRIEGDTEPNLFYVDAGNERIGIHTATPSDLVHILDNGADATIRLESTNSGGDSRIKMIAKNNGLSEIMLGDNDDSDVGLISYDHSNNFLAITVNASEKLRVDGDGRVGIGVTPSNFHANNTAVLQLKDGNSIFSRTGGQFLGIFQNIKYNSSDVTQYVANGLGSAYFQDAGVHKFFTVSSGTADNNASLSEVLRFETSGKVGIGVTNPVDHLQTNASGADSVYHGFTNSNTGVTGNDGFRVGIDSNGNANIWNHENNYTNFGTNNIERMRILSTGGLMINDDGSTRIGEPKLHVLNGGSGNNVASFFFNTSDDRDVLLIRHNGASGGTSRGMINFLNSDGNGVGHIHATGSAVSYNTSSDYRLKENAVAISDGITRLKTLKPYRFNFKTDASTTVDGFFAHEVTAVPEAISGHKDAVKEDGSIDPQGIDQSKLVPLLVAAVQELIDKVEALEAA